jgi:predicted transport protein
LRLFTNNRTYNQFQFDKEFEFEREVVLNSKLFFGTNSIYIDAKRKIETKNLGNSIPDGFLFDLSDKDNPEFYIVEVELAKHDFYNHIFPQITKFFGFYKNPKSQADLIEKIFSFINNDNELKREFKKYLGDKEIYKFLKDTIERSQNILLVIDGDKKELPEIMDTYSDTWGKMVKLILIKKFSNGTETIYSMHPDFENIEFAEIENETISETEDIEYTEEYHLEGVSEPVRNIYNELKTHVLKVSTGTIFNPQKYYISIRRERNIAFFIINRKKLRLVVMQSETETRNELKFHSIKTLTEKVQKFWNGPSCAIILETTDNLDEIKTLLTKLVTKVSPSN